MTRIAGEDSRYVFLWNPAFVLGVLFTKQARAQALGWIQNPNDGHWYAFYGQRDRSWLQAQEPRDKPHQQIGLSEVPE